MSLRPSEPVGRVEIEPKTSASGGRPRSRRQPAGSAITDCSMRACIVNALKNQIALKIYLVANNLQLHNAWNFSNFTELSGACGRYWGFGRSCLHSPEH